MENIQYSDELMITSLDGKLFLNDRQVHCGAKVQVFDEGESKWIDGKIFYLDGYQISTDNERTLGLIEGMRMRRKYKMPLL